MIDEQDTANTLHAKEATPTKFWSEAARQRMRALKKRQWKQMSSAKKRAVLTPLAHGREKQREQTEAATPWAWNCIKERLDGVGRNALVKKYGSAKQVDRVLREAQIPKSKACKWDRAVPFTNAAATELQKKSLGLEKEEFGERIGLTKKRVETWLNKPGNKLRPSEAKECIAVRSQVAKKLLDDETLKGLGNLDSYSRAAVLVTLFPRLKTEYELLLAVMPAIRAFAKTSKAAPAEKDFGNFVRREAAGKADGFPLFLRWAPDLAPRMLENWKRYQGKENVRFLVYELLAWTCSCPWKIVKAALSNRTESLGERQIRELILRHVYPPVQSAPVGAKASKKTWKHGPNKSRLEDLAWFTVGKQIEQRLPNGLKSTDSEIAEARRKWREESRSPYDPATVSRYHKKYRNLLKKRAA